MSSYAYFAGYYDELTRNVDYGKQADYLEALCHRLGHAPGLSLDLACGTGSLTVELCSAVGGDAYGDMLRGACTAAGIGTRHLAVFPAQNTSAYISIMDSEGDMLVAMSDMHILKEALTPSYVEGLLPVLNGAEDRKSVV